MHGDLGTFFKWDYYFSPSRINYDKLYILLYICQLSHSYHSMYWIALIYLNVIAKLNTHVNAILNIYVTWLLRSCTYIAAAGTWGAGNWLQVPVHGEIGANHTKESWFSTTHKLLLKYPSCDRQVGDTKVRHFYCSLSVNSRLSKRGFHHKINWNGAWKIFL